MTSDPPRDYRPNVVRFTLFVMAVGLTIYGSFRIVQSIWLALAGLVWIGVGCIVTLLGFSMLSGSPRPRGKVVLLLLANFPVAFLCALSAIDVITRVEVYVANDTRHEMEDVWLMLKSLDGGEVVIELPDLSPGQRAARALRPEDHSELWLTFRVGEEERRESVADYLSGNGAGSYLEVTMRPPANAVVSRRRPTFLWPVLP